MKNTWHSIAMCQNGLRRVLSTKVKSVRWNRGEKKREKEKEKKIEKERKRKKRKRGKKEEEAGFSPSNFWHPKDQGIGWSVLQEVGSFSYYDYACLNGV